MKHKTLIAGALAVLLPLAGAAVANDGQDKSGKAGAGFDTLDTNRDGRISRAEAAVDATLDWTTADSNGDGYLDKTEFKKAMKSKAGEPTPQPQSSPMPSEESEPAPGEPSTTPPTDTETPRQ
jgi:Ca2+-binding EF-hand superfamily protein